MRLVGLVEIFDYSKHLSLQKRESVVSLTHAHGHDFLLLQNPHNKAGIKYKLSAGNVEQVFFGVLRKRQLTIRLREPPHEVRINNNVIFIQSFGNLVKFLSKPVGPSETVKESGSQKQLEDFKNEKQLEDFKNMPQNLKVLKLHHIEMDYLPDEIAGLQQLTHLEVVNSNLVEIPAFVGTLPLTVLNLSRNRLGIKSNWDFLASPLLKENLRLLDLQKNQIQTVPNEVVKLNGLSGLHLDYNLLLSIPNGVMEMRNLRVLSVCNNRMRIFPYNLFPHATFSLSLSNNPFIAQFFVVSETPQNQEALTLKELASRVVIDHRVPVPWRTLPNSVVEYLQKARKCDVCTGAYFENFIPCCFISYSRIYAEIVPEREYLNSVTDVRNVCSRRCMHPELKFCEVLNHLTPDEYENVLRHIC
ncbi:leucine-rich repeat-containing protein 58-like isoform X1 [Schistocerca nitens]|uniref:leucine-rich repeat-containing protein 58-like isoform X1 n=2 Tax=Schistocerca nitens TaxID=7011 RepID=UPI0021188387|nr:leucine-rich repeat-containing protein 58-like isoform X1 [Schistocerca nitens]XP_049806659.1 leucine-rich repeat-containing protein 58-like isoform X1 [Schistocerca nitens]XP_049806660.1 leucine-rich repeat-containing protein 58-like isoform X1 [Schistocerca nitens]